MPAYSSWKLASMLELLETATETNTDHRHLQLRLPKGANSNDQGLDAAWGMGS